MLANAMFLAIISVALEMFLVTKQPMVRHFFNRHEIFGLIFSFSLSVFLGEIFGAQGLIAMMGGICSTVMTTIIYKTHLLGLYDRAVENKEKMMLKVAEIQEITIASLKFFWRVFTAPVRFVRSVKRGFQNIASAASAIINSLLDSCHAVAAWPKRAKRAFSIKG